MENHGPKMLDLAKMLDLKIQNKVDCTIVFYF